MAGSFDLTTVALIVFAGLVTLGLTVWMLNRAWGNFPTRMGPDDRQPPTPFAPPAQGQPGRGAGLAPHSLDADDEPDQGPDQALPAGASPENLVEVTHPLVLRAVQQAMERPGGPYATYFIRDGERAFLVLSRIADPGQRDLARRLFVGLNEGGLEDVSMDDLMRVVRQLGNRM